MATATTNAPKLVELELDKIEVREGFNPRKEPDAGLVDSLRQYDVLQPIVVTPNGKPGHYYLVIGERRLRGARAAGLDTIPAIVREGDDEDDLFELALVENLDRLDLNPIEEAKGYARVMRTRGLNQRKLADRLKVSTQTIRERLRLLRLPEPVQELVAAGSLSPGVAKPLERIAKVSPELASACAQAIADERIKPAEFETAPYRAIRLVAADKDGPLAFEPRAGAFPLSEIPMGDEQLAELNERAKELPDEFRFDGEPAVCFSDDDIDAARAYGCLLEYPDDWHTWFFVTDPVFLADRVSTLVNETIKAAEEHAREAAEEAGLDPADPTPVGDQLAERRREQGREQRKKDKAAQVEARGRNLTLGRKLAERFHAPKLTRDGARLLALLVLSRDTARLAARGLRYVREDWQEVEVKVAKTTGNRRETVTYLEPHDAEARLWQWLDQAKTAEEYVGRVLQAVIAAQLADEQAVAPTRRVYRDGRSCFYGGESAQLIDKLAKPVLPRQSKRAERKAA